MPAGETASIIISILQNGRDDWDAEGVTFPPAKVSHTLGTTLFTISGQGDMEALFEDLPRFDDEGREYVYTVHETATSGAEGYILEDISYSIEEGVRTGTILNVRGGEGGLRFDVEKVWLDDGDLLTRVPVTVGLFYKSDMTLLKTLTLTADDMWQSHIGYNPGPDGRSPEYEDYIVREISSPSILAIEGDYNGYLASGNGFARTAHHRYQVSTIVSAGSPSRYTITNLRIGKLTITVHKTWQVNDLKDRPLSATFKL